MSRVWQAGMAYFASVFALGFVFGTVRVLVIAPQFGEWRVTLRHLRVM